VSEKRTPIGKFIHTSWINVNIRAGKYKHLQTKDKCKVYDNISIEFTREEYKKWCYENKEIILSLNRPSLDRINSLENYKLNNIRIIELLDNIKRKRPGSRYLNGPLSNSIRGIRKIRNKWSSRITINQKELYLGSFETKEEAMNKFIDIYFKHYGKKPW